MMVVLKTWLLKLLIVVYVVHTLVVVPYGEAILATLTAVVIVLLLGHLRGFSRVISSFMLLTGFLIIMATGNVGLIKSSLTVNLPLVVLLVTVPVMGFPLRLGKYDEQLSNFVKKHGRNNNRLFFSITSVFFLIGPVINMGSIKLMNNLVEKLALAKGLLARSYMQGFTSTLLWSPFFASLLLVLNLVGLSLYTYLPFGLGIAVLHILVANVLYSKFAKDTAFSSAGVQTVRMRRIYELVIVFVLFFCAVFLIDRLLGISMIISVTFAAVLVAIIWSLYLRVEREFMSNVKEYSGKTILLSSNEVVLFTTAGFFGAVIATTEVGAFINRFVLLVSESSVLLLILSIILITALLALGGVHQIVTITALATTVRPLEVGVDPLIFALTLMSAWSIATILSPISAANVIIMNLIRRRYKEVAFTFNGAFILVMTGMYTIFIYVVHLFFT
ncbi:hypothetical protein [Alteribacter keqinensis]|uniref:Uncharacterized protein n=1 Tax=Alteribacter keqinensis TaxID=2483800 RepID=A0A3M7TMC1_9BACI|nr:hypothetical protein [Alteribacter keqinensis]RNA66222.1 hypothetical protein EBO34_19020 [Alteribacter keqinensis]